MSDEAQTVEVKVGETYEWKLEANPSTGYSWVVKTIEEGLTLSSEFHTDSDLCGAPGVQTLKISSSIPGEFRITAEYLRPWEHCEALESRRLFISFV